MSITIKTGLMALALLGSTALTAVTAQAADKEISWIYCGDTIDPVHTKYIKQWEEKNAGWKVTPEVVGWAQCQDKATTLAAAGTPVAMAYVGSRTLKEFAQNDLIVPVPMTDDEKKSYYPHIVDTVTFEDTQWGVNRKRASKREYEINFHRSIAGGLLLATTGRTRFARWTLARILPKPSQSFSAGCPSRQAHAKLAKC